MSIVFKDIFTLNSNSFVETCIKILVEAVFFRFYFSNIFGLGRFRLILCLLACHAMFLRYRKWLEALLRLCVLNCLKLISAFITSASLVSISVHYPIKLPNIGY